MAANENIVSAVDSEAGELTSKWSGLADDNAKLKTGATKLHVGIDNYVPPTKEPEKGAQLPISQLGVGEAVVTPASPSLSNKLTRSFHNLIDCLTFKDVVTDENIFKIIWDWLIILFALYGVICIPYYIAFDPMAAKSTENFDRFIDVIFMVNIVVSFRTAVRDANMHQVHDTWIIVHEYAKSWFIWDFIGAFPIEYFSAQFLPSLQGLRSCGPPQVCMQQTINILRVHCLFRGIHIFTSPRMHTFFWTRPLVRIFKLLVVYSLAAHLFGSMFYFVGEWQPGYTHWFEVYEASLSFPDSWSSEPTRRYVDSLYWALATMVTVGYGDIRPVTIYEKVGMRNSIPKCTQHFSTWIQNRLEVF